MTAWGALQLVSLFDERQKDMGIDEGGVCGWLGAILSFDPLSPPTQTLLSSKRATNRHTKDTWGKPKKRF